MLIIEPGGIDTSWNTTVPQVFNNIDKFSTWPIQSAPVAELNNKTFPVVIGRAVGGGSVVNGLVYVRGAERDWEAWVELGNPGWSFIEMLPYFKRTATFHPPPPATTVEFNVTWNLDAYSDENNGPLQLSINDFQFQDLSMFTLV